MEYLIFPAFIIVLMVYLLITGWHERDVLRRTSEDQLIAELKRRAFERKLKAEADSEVEAKITMNVR